MSNPFVRVDVWSLAENDPIILGYAEAVARMQAKDSNDPTSWAYQAAIHGTTAPSPLAQWNQCRHGSWYFPPWHRMFVYYFERIVRAEVVAAGGPATWALPYWNYDGGPNHNELPMPFRNATLGNGNPNPLYTSQRGVGINAGSGLPATITSPAFALSRNQFTGAAEFGGGQTSAIGQFFNQTGRLEQTPHNDIHNAIGGLMMDPDTAALDPIFWLHHANIDRLWWQWQQQAGNQPATDPAWTSQTFSFFDVGGSPASLADSDVLNTVTQLDYTYDVAPAVATATWHPALQVNWPRPFPTVRAPIPINPPDPGPDRTIVGGTQEPITLVGNEVRAPITVDQPTVETLAEAEPGSHLHRAYLDIDDVEASKNPGAVYAIYLNLPPTPTAEDLTNHHAGNISFFGIERAQNPRGDEHGHGLHVSMDVTGLLDRLAASGEWQDGGQLNVTFVPQVLEAPAEHPEMRDELVSASAHPDQPVTIGRVSLYFA